MAPKMNNKSALVHFFVISGGLLGRLIFDEILVGTKMTTNPKNDSQSGPKVGANANWGSARRNVRWCRGGTKGGVHRTRHRFGQEFGRKLGKDI